MVFYSNPTIQKYNKEVNIVKEEIKSTEGENRLTNNNDLMIYNNNPIVDGKNNDIVNIEITDCDRIAYPIPGTVDDVDKLTMDNLIKYYNKYYIANNMVMVISGNIDENKVSKVINETFGNENTPNKESQVEYDLKYDSEDEDSDDEDDSEDESFIDSDNYDNSEHSPNNSNHREPRLIYDIYEDSENTDILLSYKICGFSSVNCDDIYPLYIYSDMLTGGINSLLLKTLREEEKLVYTVDSNLDIFNKHGTFNIQYSTDNINIKKTIHLINAILSNYKLKQKDLNKAKKKNNK